MYVGYERRLPQSNPAHTGNVSEGEGLSDHNPMDLGARLERTVDASGKSIVKLYEIVWNAQGRHTMPLTMDLAGTPSRCQLNSAVYRFVSTPGTSRGLPVTV